MKLFKKIIFASFFCLITSNSFAANYDFGLDRDNSPYEGEPNYQDFKIFLPKTNGFFVNAIGGIGFLPYKNGGPCDKSFLSFFCNEKIYSSTDPFLMLQTGYMFARDNYNDWHLGLGLTGSLVHSDEKDRFIPLATPTFFLSKYLNKRFSMAFYVGSWIFMNDIGTQASYNITENLSVIAKYDLNITTTLSNMHAINLLGLGLAYNF